MTAYETGTEAVLLGEVGGDEGKNVQWEAVDGSERVPPFLNSQQCGRGVLIKPRDLIQSDATKGVSTYVVPKTPKYLVTYDGEKAVRFSSSFRAKTS